MVFAARFSLYAAGDIHRIGPHGGDGVRHIVRRQAARQDDGLAESGLCLFRQFPVEGLAAAAEFVGMVGVEQKGGYRLTESFDLLKNLLIVDSKGTNGPA